MASIGKVGLSVTVIWTNTEYENLKSYWPDGANVYLLSLEVKTLDDDENDCIRNRKHGGFNQELLFFLIICNTKKWISLHTCVRFK